MTAVETAVSRERFDRFVDISAVVLISLAAVLSAWCGYQSARWSTLATRSYNEASAHRLQAAEWKDRSNALKIVDVNLFLQYIIALEENQPRVRDFLYHRFRPETRPAVFAWLATHPLTNPNAPSSPFVMPQFRSKEDVLAAQLDAAASHSFSTAQAANENADTYVRLTVLFAAVSFLAGICTKFRYPLHGIVVGAGFVMLFYGLLQLVRQPSL